MATQKIINGPGKWDLALAIMDGSKLTFTLEGGITLPLVRVEGTFNMSGHVSIENDPPERDLEHGFVREGHLLIGYTDWDDGSRSDEKEVLMEYRLTSRSGICAIVDRMSEGFDSLFTPIPMSKAMGITDNVYSN
jgi:hypothetical protein